MALSSNSLFKARILVLVFPTNKTQQIAPTEPKVNLGTVLDTGGTESGEIRKIVWKGALEVFRNNSVFGTGVETFAYSYYNYRLCGCLFSFARSN